MAMTNPLRIRIMCSSHTDFLSTVIRPGARLRRRREVRQLHRFRRRCSADSCARMPTQIQLAACRAFGNGSRSSTQLIMNSCVRCGCDPPCPLPWMNERCCLLAVVHPPGRERLDALRAAGARSRAPPRVRRFADVDDGTLLLDLRPFERHLAAVHVEALAVLARRVEQRAHHLGHEIRVAAS